MAAAARTVTAALLVLLPALAPAQSVCTNEGQPAAGRWLERFVSADCADCWTDPSTPAAGHETQVLDWVVPGIQGDDAPLSAVARREASERLEALRLDRPPRATTQSATLPRRPVPTLRIARGPALNGYIGIGLRIGPVPRALEGAQIAIALVETLPAGTEGSPVARNLVRNVHYPAWKGHFSLSKTKKSVFSETRTMNIPEGAQPDRLQLVAWVWDRHGQVVAAYRTDCKDKQAGIDHGIRNEQDQRAMSGQ